MSLLKSAIDSICMGVEDYKASSKRRIISATRNIYSGILLLFKYKLSSLSPDESNEVLIKTRILPKVNSVGEIFWVGVGKTTVDVRTIQKRFESLDIFVDWSRIKKINEYRNDIEHYFSTNTQSSIQQLISDSFLVIRDFITDHLQKDPRKLLGDEIWNILLEANEVFEKEKKECEKAVNTLIFFSEETKKAFNNYSCKACGSALIMPSSYNIDACEVEYECKSCGKVLPYHKIAGVAVSDHYSVQVYLAHTDGGETPISECPECGGVYIYEEGICSECGCEAEHECIRCSNTITPEELITSPYCGFCNYMMSKDD